MVRSEMSSRSNSASAAKIPKTSFPAGVVVSIAAPGRYPFGGPGLHQVGQPLQSDQDRGRLRGRPELDGPTQQRHEAADHGVALHQRRTPLAARVGIRRGDHRRQVGHCVSKLAAGTTLSMAAQIASSVTPPPHPSDSKRTPTAAARLAASRDTAG